jgi:riboflavin transporter FmnP
VFVCGSIYKNNRTKKGAIIALSVATITLVIAAFFVNLFVMLPLYMGGAPFETRLNLDLFTIAPFNLMRGAVLSLITILIYKKISRFLK